MFLLQQIVLVLPVVKQRISTGIKAPTLYPRDGQIKELKLAPYQVENYMRAQRAHQNNVEFTSVFMALFLVTGLFPEVTLHVALAGAASRRGRVTLLSTFSEASGGPLGAWVVLFRLLGGVGYLFGVRQIGSFFHLGELYILYLAATQALRSPTAPSQTTPSSATSAAHLLPAASCVRPPRLLSSPAGVRPRHARAARPARRLLLGRRRDAGGRPKGLGRGQGGRRLRVRCSSPRVAAVSGTSSHLRGVNRYATALDSLKTFQASASLSGEGLSLFLA